MQADPTARTVECLLTDAEVAAQLGVRLKTVVNWRQRGEGPRWVKIGKRAVRYKQSAVTEFISAGERGA